MALWIRSQDKTTLCEANNVRCVSQNNKYAIITKTCGGLCDTLAIYNTQKRCVEVLDLIQTKLIKAKSITVIFELPKDN